MSAITPSPTIRPTSASSATGKVPVEDSREPARLEVRSLKKSFDREGGRRVGAVQDINLAVGAGEIVVLLGPSGCGKSSLLRCIAGLEDPDGGSIAVAGKTVFDSKSRVMLPPEKRDINMMFQSYALWPHMTLQDNVAYPLVTRGTSRKAARARADEFLDLVGLRGLNRQYPSRISGGQQQRVALARTLISEPSVILFDEPLSNVDAKVRIQLRRELLRIHQELHFAAIYVTHDQEEAMGIGNRIAVMREGQIIQLDDPVRIYEHPYDRYAAEFVGAANIIAAELTSSDGSTAVFQSGLGPIEADAQTAWRSIDEDVRVGSRVALMVRPEYCVLDSGAGGSANRWPVTIERTLYAGSHTELYCSVAGSPMESWVVGSPERLLTASELFFGFPKSAVRVISVERDGDRG